MLTEKDINDLANSPPAKDGEQEKPKKPEDIQYYLSKKITLKLLSEHPELTVDDGGKLIITNWTKRRQITIAKRKEGKLLFIDDYGYLVVGFEKDYQDCLIKFAQLRKGDGERYYLVYDNIRNSSIKYGADFYAVNFAGNDLPCLEIKKKELPKTDPGKRRALGWKVGE
jgi:hypothetical protein